MPPKPSPLASEFEPADESRWRALVEKGLKGADFSSLVRSTAGLSVEPLYTADDAGPVLQTRPSPSDDPDRPWDLRTAVEHPNPARANEQALQDLNGGAQSLLLRLDASAQTGTAVASQDDLARVLDGVLLELAPVALEAGWMGPDAANWLAILAKGAPNAPLAFHMDPISAFLESGRSPGPLAAHINAAAQTMARHAGAYPKATGFLATGRVIHETGGLERQELAVMASSAVAYARAMVDDAGMDPADAFSRIVLGVSANEDVFATIAHMRAARAIWARLTAEAGVNVPARIEARSSNRMLSRLDPWTNLLRLTAAGFGAGVGGADTVLLEPFTRPRGLANDLARRQARNTQLVLMEEAGLGRVADPAGGGWYVEYLTEYLAENAWRNFQVIEKTGGVAKGLNPNALLDVREERAFMQAALKSKHTPLLGVTVFRNPHETTIDLETVDRTAFGRPFEVAKPGPDSTTEALTPLRWAEPFEEGQP